MKSKATRVSAEGVLLALEFMAAEMMSADKASPMVHMEVIDGKFKTDNMAGAMFSVIHPWVALHSEGNVCDNDLDKHEIEYSHMIEIVEKVLKARGGMEEGFDLG